MSKEQSAAEPPRIELAGACAEAAGPTHVPVRPTELDSQLQATVLWLRRFGKEPVADWIERHLQQDVRLSAYDFGMATTSVERMAEGLLAMVGDIDPRPA